MRARRPSRPSRRNCHSIVPGANAQDLALSVLGGGHQRIFVGKLPGVAAAREIVEIQRPTPLPHLFRCPRFARLGVEMAEQEAVRVHQMGFNEVPNGPLVTGHYLGGNDKPLWLIRPFHGAAARNGATMVQVSV